MTDITPPLELVNEWYRSFNTNEETDEDWDIYLARTAAQYGADQELEACLHWASEWCGAHKVHRLLAARRPKTPSLKQQVLATLKYPKDLWSEAEVEAIYRLVEQLDD